MEVVTKTKYCDRCHLEVVKHFYSESHINFNTIDNGYEIGGYSKRYALCFACTEMLKKLLTEK